MLNTEVTFSRDLSEDMNICHLLNNFPQLTTCLFVNIMWQLKLETFFYESLKFSPSWFVLPFLPEVSDSLRFAKPLDVIAHVKEIVESIYYNICRFDFKVLHSGQQEQQTSILDKLLEHIMSFLRSYNPPNADDDVVKSNRKLKEYLGYSLNHQLSLIFNCFKMFLNKPSFEVQDELKIFKIMYEPEVNNFSTKSYSPSVKETLLKINIALLNTLQNSVLNITIDDWVYWVEIDIDDPSTYDEDLKRDNLQKQIGELSYNLIQLINENPSFEHSVVNQLQTLSIKPKMLKEIAKEATVGTILDKIEKSANKRVWFEELLDRPDTLYSNTECLQTVIDNIEIVNFKDLMRILKEQQNYELDPEDEAQIKEILRLGGVARLDNLEVRNFIEEMIRVFGVDYNFYTDEAGDGAFTNEITNYFNRMTEKELIEDQLWKLILLNPSRFYESLLENLKDQDKSQIDIVLKILNETNSIAGEFVKDLVESNLDAAAEPPKSMYHIFLAGLFKLNLIDRQEFLRDIIMKNLARAIAEENLKLIDMLLNALKLFSGRLNVADLLSPLAVLVAQPLDIYRWDLVSFSQLKESIVETSIEIIQDFVKTILIHGKKVDKDFILTKVNNCKPMTKFYFQKFSYEKGESIGTFDKFLKPEGFESFSKSEITSFLCENIVRCTTKELKWLMSNEKLQFYLTDALFVVTVIVARSNQQEATNCLHKCVSDYVRILKVSLTGIVYLYLILISPFF